MLKIIEKYLGVSLLIVCILFWCGFFKIGISAINGNKTSQIIIFTITAILTTCMVFIVRGSSCYTLKTDNELGK